MPGISRSTETILLLDDETSDRELMRTALQEQGYKVLEASYGYSAMQLFRTHQQAIAMLVADIALPGENGCEVAKAMVGIEPDLNVLFVSGHAGAEICRFYGFPVSDSHFLRKPFTAAEFTNRVRHLLDTAEPLPSDFSKARTPPKTMWRRKPSERDSEESSPEREC